MTHSDHCHNQFSFYAQCSQVLVPSYRERTQRFSVPSLPQLCLVACCDFTSSDDDEHNTENNFLLLFADVDITPTLIEGLTEVDVLHTALGCRFALDIFTISQHIPLHLITSHFLTILSSPHFEHGCYTRLMTATMARLLGPGSWKGTHTLSLSLCGRNSWLHTVNSRHVDFHRSCTERFE